jgi:hypothetical protein
MGFLHNLKLWLRPPKISDPVFGPLIFMHINNPPERSYWEGYWTFPNTGNGIGVFLRGGEEGPIQESREFYLSLPDRFELIVESCRPQLEEVFREWLNRELPQDMFRELKLTGFGAEDAGKNPVKWDVSFETKGEKWLSITIPFVGEIAGAAEIDT